MDDLTYHTSPGPDSSSSKPMLLDVVWDAVQARLLEIHAGNAAQAEADRRAADLEQSRVWGSVDDARNVLDVPLPFATRPGAALIF